MAVVGPDLVEKHVRDSSILSRMWKLLTGDPEVQELLRMSNVNAVKRLLYNDHGPVHARIVAGSALEIWSILHDAGIQASGIVDETLPDDEHVRLVILTASYLHDIGNSIHRLNHEFAGALLARDILSRILPQVVDDVRLRTRIISEVMHAIYATNMDVEALTVEASIVKVADATDMAEGRARYPYAKGKADIHAISALSIKKVILKPGNHRPLRIEIEMEDLAGLFQVERILLPKIRTSKIREHIEIVPRVNGSRKIIPSPILP